MATRQASLPKLQLTGPFDSFRDFVLALEKCGLLLRIPEMDQDQYEASAFAYRLVDKFGMMGGPAFLSERMKIEGKWVEGPVIANLFGTWQSEALSFGVENIPADPRAAYRVTFDKIMSTTRNGAWHRIKPRVNERGNAPCKEIILKGDDIDIRQYPWLKCNPADGGRYVNSGAVIIEDPQIGRNVGTYRCMIKGRDRITINSEVGQHGWRLLMQAKRRGEHTVKCAVVVGADPITWSMSCSKISDLGEDEYELAGGFLGKPLEVVKCETSDILVPATAEMVIEGEIPLNSTDDDGPHAEMYGYLGQRRPDDFFLNIQAITQRKRPWIFNNHTGVLRGFCTIPSDVHAYLHYKKSIPHLTAISTLSDSVGIMVASIEKRFPGDGLAAGQQILARNFVTKVVIIVDNDIDILDRDQVINAIAARWQPLHATSIIPFAPASLLEPSAPQPRVSSKAVIDATKQLPAEGGPKEWPALSRTLFEENAPTAFALVDSKWDQYWSGGAGGNRPA